MTNIFLGSESMEHQLSNALSTMFLRHLVMFLHFETYALANPQKRDYREDQDFNLTSCLIYRGKMLPWILVAMGYVIFRLFLLYKRFLSDQMGSVSDKNSHR